MPQSFPGLSRYLFPAWIKGRTKLYMFHFLLHPFPKFSPSFTKTRAKLGETYAPSRPKSSGKPENKASPSFQKLGKTWGFHSKLGKIKIYGGYAK